MPLGERADEGMTARGKASHFDVEEQPRYQGGFSSPSLDHGTLFVGLIVVPNRHDRETRRDQEHRRVEHDAHSIVLIRAQRRESLCADRPGIRGVASFAPYHLELSDVGDVLNRRATAQTSEKAREHLAVMKQRGRTRRLADDESAGHGTKRLTPDQAADDGKTRNKDLDRARTNIGGKTAVRMPTVDGARGERRKRAGLESPKAVLNLQRVSSRAPPEKWRFRHEQRIPISVWAEISIGYRADSGVLSGTIPRRGAP
jgi:hypothetical protein